MELFAALDRMIGVGRLTRVSVRNWQTMNRMLLTTSRLMEDGFLDAGTAVRSVRSALRMSQVQLARRSGVPQAHIARLEGNRLDPRLATLRKLLDAMFCELLILPRARHRLSDALAERRLATGRYRRPWDD